MQSIAEMNKQEQEEAVKEDETERRSTGNGRHTRKRMLSSRDRQGEQEMGSITESLCTRQ